MNGGRPDVTFWNGEPCEARMVRVRVGASMAPTWWCADMEGDEMDAVEVNYGGKRSYLANHDGSGWWKVTVGQGSPRWSHRSLPDSSEVLP